MIVNIRAATPHDMAAIIRLEQESSTAAHWTRQQYQQLFQLDSGPMRLVVVVEAEISFSSLPTEFFSGSSQDSTVVGYLVARQIAPEWELENIVVDRAARNRGLGNRLLAFLLARARETNSDAIFLEVRESNTAARKLYARAGFDQTGRRNAYYTNPREDAILYRLKVV